MRWFWARLWFCFFSWRTFVRACCCLGTALQEAIILSIYDMAIEPKQTQAARFTLVPNPSRTYCLAQSQAARIPSDRTLMPPRNVRVSSAVRENSCRRGQKGRLRRAVCPQQRQHRVLRVQSLLGPAVLCAPQQLQQGVSEQFRIAAAAAAWRVGSRRRSRSHRQREQSKGCW